MKKIILSLLLTVFAMTTGVQAMSPETNSSSKKSGVTSKDAKCKALYRKYLLSSGSIKNVYGELYIKHCSKGFWGEDFKQSRRAVQEAINLATSAN